MLVFGHNFKLRIQYGRCDFGILRWEMLVSNLVARISVVITWALVVVLFLFLVAGTVIALVPFIVIENLVIRPLKRVWTIGKPSKPQFPSPWVPQAGDELA